MKHEDQPSPFLRALNNLSVISITFFDVLDGQILDLFILAGMIEAKQLESFLYRMVIGKEIPSLNMMRLIGFDWTIKHNSFEIIRESAKLSFSVDATGVLKATLEIRKDVHFIARWERFCTSHNMPVIGV